jgi:NAD(P)-dependent dehydrogenase (short-subunit alcohol dehydrogenase family)
MKQSKVVLITGCSSGIGRALSEEFHRRGHQVVATARRMDSIQDLRSKGMTTYQLDVTNQDEARHVVASILASLQRIDVLVNNAGFGLMGPTLDIPEEELMSQFRTNVIGPQTMTRLVAPSMRKNGGGLIVNIGSISGLVTTPFAGAYCASKAALHAFSDALRVELEPFGIRVITVQPGGIVSNFGGASAKLAERILKEDSWYAPLREQIQARASISQVGAMKSEMFASKIVDILESPTPPPIVRLGKRSFSLPLIKWTFRTSLFDTVMRRQFGLNKLP